jgi:hypothetical protein
MWTSENGNKHGRDWWVLRNTCLVDRKGRRMGFPRRVLGREVMMMIPFTVTVRVDLLLFAMMTFEMSMIRFRLE